MGDARQLARVQHRRLDDRGRDDRAVARDADPAVNDARQRSPGDLRLVHVRLGQLRLSGHGHHRDVRSLSDGARQARRRRERRRLRARTAPRDGQVVLSVLHRAIGVPAGLPPADSRRDRRLHEPEEAADGVLLLCGQRGHMPAVLRHRQPLPGRRPASGRRQPVLWRVAGAIQRVPQRHHDGRSAGQGVEPRVCARLSGRWRAAARQSRPAAECGGARHRRWAGGAPLVPVGRTLVGRLLDRHVPAAAIPGGGNRAAGRRFGDLCGPRGAGRVVPRPPPSAAHAALSRGVHAVQRRDPDRHRHGLALSLAGALCRPRPSRRPVVSDRTDPDDSVRGVFRRAAVRAHRRLHRVPSRRSC